MADDIRANPNDPERREAPRHERRAVRRGEAERARVYQEGDTSTYALPAAIRRISWGAIFAGAIIALVTQLALSLLGASIGLGTAESATGGETFAGFNTAAGIWMAISSIVALLGGGYVASRLAGMPDRTDGILHGIVTWGLVTIVAAFFTTVTLGGMLDPAEIGQTAGPNVSTAALWGFIAMVVGAISAAVGGAIGVPRDLPASAAVRRE